MVEIYIINETRKEFTFVDEGYHVEIGWLYRHYWNVTDLVFILNMNECGLIIDDQESYTEIVYDNSKK